jgi:hypothetical protein
MTIFEKFKSPTARAYYVNKNNQPLIDQGEKVVFSKDKAFALVYTQADVIQQTQLMDAIEAGTQLLKQSYEDAIYQSFLHETGVETPKPISTGGASIPVSKQTEMMVEFEGNEHFPLYVILNKLEAIKGGSPVVFIQGSGKKEDEEFGILNLLDEA